MNNALDIQIGGLHYKNMNPQPVVMFACLNWDYFRSSITKYMVRYRNKNGREDLEKAKHLFLLAEQLQVKKGCSAEEVEYVNMFCNKNRIEESVRNIVKAAMYGDWMIGYEMVSILIGAEYPEDL